MKRKRTRRAVLLLLFLAPVCGEIMSTSAPPVEFFQPVSLVFLVALYGCGALLIREVVRRWNQGWMSIFLLGMAYGIYEEGIVVRSFFDPTWMDLGILAEYGRWLGVNWVWTLWLTIFHAIISITIPIALVELVFPTLRDELWLGKRGMIIAALPFLGMTAIGPLFGMKASWFALLASATAMGFLALLAYFAPRRAGDTADVVKPSRPGRIMAQGFFLMTALFLTFMALPEMGIPVLLTMALGTSLVFFGIRRIRRSGGAAWRDLHRWAAAAGVLLPWLIIDVIAWLDNPNRPDDTSGMALFAVLAFVLLMALGWRISRREKKLKVERFDGVLDAA